MYIPETILMFRKKTLKSGFTPAFPVRKGGKEDTARAWQSWPLEPVELANVPKGGYRLVAHEHRREGSKLFTEKPPNLFETGKS